jgi:RNA 2',3'-cyclic 3'-phosphodiesterase
VQPDQLHITLRFLASLDNEAIEKVIQTAHRIGEATVPFAVTVGGLGAFPSIKRPRVLWVGINQGEEDLVVLHDMLDYGLCAVGLDPEDKDPFRPHITLARVNLRGGSSDAAELSNLLTRNTNSAPTASFTARGLSVMRSRLEHGGAHHEELQSAPFGV